MDDKKLKWRSALLLTIVLVIIAVFCARLAQLQIAEADRYENITADTDSYTIYTDAPRGEIFDVNGVPLAVNDTLYNVVINKLFIADDEINDTIASLIELTERCGDKWTDDLPIRLGVGEVFYFNEKKTDEIDTIKDKNHLNMNPYATAGDCMAAFSEKYGCGKYPAKVRRNIVSVRWQMEKNGFSNSCPYVFAENISSGTVNSISEKMKDIKGVSVEPASVRVYKNGTAAPHIIGVTGLISDDEYRDLKDQGYSYDEIIGKNGIEGAFEKYLRGYPGSRTYEIGADSKAVLTKTTAAKSGDSIYLTINTKYQTAAQQALKEAVQEANDYSVIVGDENMGADCSGAAMVMLRVKDFAVLCAANYPGYDISEFYDDYTKLSQDSSSPLFDRAFCGALAPGSTFKPMVASAALQEGVITPETRINCDGIYTKNNLDLRCMWEHGELDLYGALRESCNVYFAETARLIGIEKINMYAKRCGLGVKTGVEVSESSGTLAGPEYSRQMGTQWYDSFVSFAGIGQSDNQFTPLQLAAYAATIANNGTRLKTHIVDRIISSDGKELLNNSKPQITDSMGVDLKNLKAVQKGMYTAARSYPPLDGIGIAIAGKTGTAENNGSDHANFICYAPYDKPEVAVAVMVEHGTKSFVAINAARKLLEMYFLDHHSR